MKALEKLRAGADSGVVGASFFTDGSFEGSDILRDSDASPVTGTAVEEEDEDMELRRASASLGANSFAAAFVLKVGRLADDSGSVGSLLGSYFSLMCSNLLVS